MDTTMTVTSVHQRHGLTHCPTCGYAVRAGARLWVTDGKVQCRNCRYPLRWLSAAETAKLLRTALRAAFPATTFSIRSETYAGGASINVRWTDGPARDAVEAITCQYRGSDFDGSIDMASGRDHWLLPDGTVTLESAQGTEGSMGYIPRAQHEAPCTGAQRVHFGSDHVFCERETAAETAHRKEWEAAWEAKRKARNIARSLRAR